MNRIPKNIKKGTIITVIFEDDKMYHGQVFNIEKATVDNISGEWISLQQLYPDNISSEDFGLCTLPCQYIKSITIC